MTDQPKPRPLSDADLLAWAVILGYREQQHARGSNIILLPYPPCPTCGGDVSGITTYQRRDRFDSRLTAQPCEHEHAVDEAQMERIYWHIGDMMQLLDTASRWPAGESSWNTERIIADARARVGEPEETPRGPIGWARKQQQDRAARPDGEPVVPAAWSQLEARARKAEATLARVEALAARIAAGHPVQDNPNNLAAAIRDAASTSQTKET